MNNSPYRLHWIPWVLAAIVSVGVGMLAFNAGLARGLAANTTAGTAALAWHPFWFHPFGFVGPLFFLFFWFVIARALFWGGPWRRRWHDPRYDGVPPRFEEWHRRMHERMNQEPSGPPRA